MNKIDFNSYDLAFRAETHSGGGTSYIADIPGVLEMIVEHEDQQVIGWEPLDISPGEFQALIAPAEGEASTD